LQKRRHSSSENPSRPSQGKSVCLPREKPHAGRISSTRVCFVPSRALAIERRRGGSCATWGLPGSTRALGIAPVRATSTIPSKFETVINAGTKVRYCNPATPRATPLGPILSPGARGGPLSCSTPGSRRRPTIARSVRVTLPSMLFYYQFCLVANGVLSLDPTNLVPGRTRGIICGGCKARRGNPAREVWQPLTVTAQRHSRGNRERRRGTALGAAATASTPLRQRCPVSAPP
jgi:hypothetical protein